MISIIVPVYNVEKYLSECIESILLQTFEDFELILIDDGSKDRSGDICDKYAVTDSRVKVIHQENRGLSGARNVGLAASRGEYIVFIDSDDTLTSDYLEKRYAAICKTNADFVFSDMESSKLAYSESLTDNELIIGKAEMKKWLYDLISREYVLAVIACNKLYKASLLKGLSFSEGRLHEDEFFINDVLCRMTKAVYIPDKGYIYRDNEQGITGARNLTSIRHLDALDAYAERIRMANVEGDYSFANKTLSNALYKAYSYYKTGSEISEPALTKLIELFNEFYKVLSFKQKLKYKVLILLAKLR
jgi:glycosyltransferase involved in cell wall biosynthesis